MTEKKRASFEEMAAEAERLDLYYVAVPFSQEMQEMQEIQKIQKIQKDIMQEQENKKTKKTEADVIWEEIKDVKIPMFSLPNQTVSQHVKKLKVPGEQLLVKLNSTAVLPVLEDVLKHSFEVEQADEFVIVRRKSPTVDVSKLIEK